GPDRRDCRAGLSLCFTRNDRLALAKYPSEVAAQKLPRRIKPAAQDAEIIPARIKHLEVRRAQRAHFAPMRPSVIAAKYLLHALEQLFVRLLGILVNGDRHTVSLIEEAEPGIIRCDI